MKFIINVVWTNSWTVITRCRKFSWNDWALVVFITGNWMCEIEFKEITPHGMSQPPAYFLFSNKILFNSSPSWAPTVFIELIEYFFYDHFIYDLRHSSKSFKTRSNTHKHTEKRNRLGHTKKILQYWPFLTRFLNKFAAFPRLVR
jgi:hypothetical protein